MGVIRRKNIGLCQTLKTGERVVSSNCLRNLASTYFDIFYLRDNHIGANFDLMMDRYNKCYGNSKLSSWSKKIWDEAKSTW